MHPGATLAAGGATGVAPALRRGPLRPSGSPPFLPARHARATSKCGAKAGDGPPRGRFAKGRRPRLPNGRRPLACTHEWCARGVASQIDARPRTSARSPPPSVGWWCACSPRARGQEARWVPRPPRPRCDASGGRRSQRRWRSAQHFVTDRDPPSGRWRTAAIGVFAARPESAESPSQRAAKHQGEPAGQTETVSYT